MNKLSDTVQEYCTSEHFIFLDPALKEYAESLLTFWCDKAGNDITEVTIEAASKQVAHLDVPLSIRKAFPALLTAFFEYLAGSGRFPQARSWLHLVTRLEKSYGDSMRDDGSVRGKTYQKAYPNVGRNDPCPCGSGKKYKKCCDGLFS